MLGALGALAAGTAYYFYGTAGTPQETAQELKSKAEGLGAAAEGKLGMRHSKADYQKVYDRIAEMMEKEDHDGECYTRRSEELQSGTITLQPTERTLEYPLDALGLQNRWIARTGPRPTRLARFRHL